MRKVSAFALMMLLALPALADITTKTESGRVTVGGTSKVIYQFATPVPSGARRLKGQGRAFSLINRTAGSKLWCNPNVDSSLAAPAVADDTTPNQIILDDLTPSYAADGFNAQKLQCISDGSAVLDWTVNEL